MFCIYIYIYRQGSSCPGGCLGSIPSFQCKFESLSCHNFGKKSKNRSFKISMAISYWPMLIHAILPIPKFQTLVLRIKLKKEKKKFYTIRNLLILLK